MLFSMRLRQNGYSITAPRQLIFERLMKREKQSMNELLKHCQKIDRASVYRTIELFEQLGIVQRVYSGWKYQLELGEDFQDHHHHALCRICSKHINLPEDIILEKQIERLAETHHFSLERHSLELQGICEDCLIHQNLWT